MNNDYGLLKAQDLLQRAENVLIFAGAGMSAELGTRVYWAGSEAQYGGHTSPQGYTDLEHAHASLWNTDEAAQLTYFNESWQEMLTVDFCSQSSPYFLLKQYLETASKNFFVLTTNVDGAFARSGWSEDSLYELHGSYRYSQCLAYPSQHGVFLTKEPSEGLTLCPTCYSLTRPNVLFFDDYAFNDSRIKQQANMWSGFQPRLKSPTVILEIGAGDKVPTLRNYSYKFNVKKKIPVIRINPGNHAADLNGKFAPYIKLKETVGTVFAHLLQLPETD